MSEKEGVGVRIKKIRLNLDLSQKEFSETMEVTQSLLSMIENGRSMPTTIFINRLCDKFNASINYIHNGAGEMFSPIAPSPADRVLTIMHENKMTLEGFVAVIGPNRMSDMLDVMSGKNPSRELIFAVGDAFPQYKQYLNTGAATDILLEESVKYKVNNRLEGSNMIPLFPMSAHGTKLSEFAMGVKKYDCELVVSPVSGAEFAITVTGNSMADEYPPGSKVLVRRINSDLFVEPGKVYVLDTVNGVMLKVVTIRRDGYLYCTSINSDQVTYAPFEIPISCVYGMYRVLMCISEK